MGNVVQITEKNIGIYVSQYTLHDRNLYCLRGGFICCFIRDLDLYAMIFTVVSYMRQRVYMCVSAYILIFEMCFVFYSPCQKRVWSDCLHGISDLSPYASFYNELCHLKNKVWYATWFNGTGLLKLIKSASWNSFLADLSMHHLQPTFSWI